MLEVEFEPMITASERAKTAHALDRSATVTGEIYVQWCNCPEIFCEGLYGSWRRNSKAVQGLASQELMYLTFKKKHRSMAL
jgi:hypothetical protein